jgi:hypothetical protein
LSNENIRKPPLLFVLVGILFLEAGALASATLWFLSRVFLERADSLAAALVILIIVALVTVWVTVTAIYTLKGRPWVRGGILTWQILQIAVAAGAFQGFFAQPSVGYALLIPAVVASLLLFSPSVLRATTRDEDVAS